MHVWSQNVILSSAIYPTRYNVTQFIYFYKLLYMFRVVSPPIIRSTHNCIYSIWYLSNRYCYLPLLWNSWRWFECAVGIVWICFVAVADALYAREKPGTHCTGGWVGPRSVLDRCGKSRPHRDSIPGPSSP